MSVLTKYILRAHLPPFLFALSVLTGILMINTVARRLVSLAGKGLPTSVILEVFMLSIPHVFALTLPMAVLVAVLYTFSQLAADNEITAMKASGVDLSHLLKPVVVAATVLAVFMIWFNDSLLPESNNRLAALLLDIGRKSPTLQLEERVINEIQAGDLRTKYFLQAARIEPATNRLEDVTIYDLSSPQRQRSIYADSGRMAFNRDSTDLFLTLWDGWLHDLEHDEPQRSLRTFFRDYRIQIEDVGNTLQRSERGVRSDREMSIAMLADRARDTEQALAAVREQAVETATEAVDRSLNKGRLEPVERPRPVPGVATGDGGGESPARADTAAAAAAGQGAAGSAVRVVGRRTFVPDGPDEVARRAAVQLRTISSRAGALERRANSYWVEYHKKYAIAFACIIFVLIGAPVAIRFPRGGVGMVMAVSMGIFAIYWIGLIGGEQLADKGRISPVVAMWSSNALFLLMALWGIRRIGHEVSTSRGGGWDDLAYTLKGVVTRPFRRGGGRPRPTREPA